MGPSIFRSSPGDDLIEWNSGGPSSFDLIWCVGRSPLDMRTSVSSKLMVDGDSMGPGLQLVGA